jgi:hypothetical protein
MVLPSLSRLLRTDASAERVIARALSAAGWVIQDPRMMVLPCSAKVESRDGTHQRHRARQNENKIRYFFDGVINSDGDCAVAPYRVVNDEERPMGLSAERR